MKTYYVYMLQCFDGTFYVGVTNDLEYRIAQHHHGEYRNCYTYMRRPLVLVYAGEFTEIEEAITFEKQLKGWSHRKKRTFAQKKWTPLKAYARGKHVQDRVSKSPQPEA